MSISSEPRPIRQSGFPGINLIRVVMQNFIQYTSDHYHLRRTPVTKKIIYIDSLITAYLTHQIYPIIKSLFSGTTTAQLLICITVTKTSFTYTTATHPYKNFLTNYKPTTANIYNYYNK